MTTILKPGWLQRDTLAAATSVAWDNLRLAKRRMDEAQAAFDVAESEWSKASAECDRLDRASGQHASQIQED